ncbi:hypothetical protein H072_3143 [Dactylellina haptotyla CBS 200.50]|uniref:DUF676 domain-containing protein n=1 Tax=Dactylellina haptotyla (strain CBS 200.50) TaxID=1284197 RepID=S8C5D3_DACHA|nr:hypothetical protein H072_3143 [Dactylellina haptotyla CBS 200.50]
MAIVGLKPLTDYSKSHKVVDIIAVHGIGANPDSTWTKNGKHWLQDGDMLPAAVPNARILRFAYESQWLGKNMISQKLPDVAESLLRALKQERQNCPHRPIIFVGHCFGGIVIEKALTAARITRGFSNIVDHVAGVVFLATPHKGTGSQSSAAVVANIAAYAGIGQRSQLVDSLEPQSDFLEDIVRSFSQLANDIRIPLRCFFEQRKTDVSAIIRAYMPPFLRFRAEVMVVDEHSACLDGFERIGLGLNHFQINKFDGPDDGYYKTVRDQIQGLVTEAYECVQKRILQSGTTFHVSPPRNLNFTGRSDTLDELEELVQVSEDGQRRAALYGLEGIGKTSIAIELAYRVRTRCNVFWTEGSTNELFKNSLLSIGEKVNILTGASRDPNIVRDWLNSEESGPWLLIVDNAQSLRRTMANGDHKGPIAAEAELDDIEDFLPTNRGTIILTTSDREIMESLEDGWQEIDITSMQPDEATDLLFKLGTSLPNLVRSEVSTLVADLGHFPIAIVQAVANMKYLSKSVKKYAQELQEQMEKHTSTNDSLEHLLTKRGSGLKPRKEQHQQSLLETWDISYRPLAEANQSAASLLQVFSLLSSSPIARKFLHPELLSRIGFTSEQQIDQALAMLCSFAFTSVSGEDEDRVYQVHRLVILWSRSKITDHENIANITFDLIRECFPQGSQNTLRERQEGAIILSHARSIESYCTANPKVEQDKVMNLKRKIGRYYARTGSPLEAETHMKACIAYHSNKDTEDSQKELATCHTILGTSLQFQAKFEEAIQNYDIAFSLRSKVFGPDHQSTMDILGDKADSLYSLGRLKEALESYLATYTCIKASDSGGARLAHILNGMANVYKNIGDAENARKCFSEGYQAAIKAHGYEHPTTWTLMNGLVGLLDDLQDHEAQEEAKAIFIDAVRNIAQKHKLELEESQQDIDLTEAQEKVFPIVKRLLGEKHTSTIGYMDYLATCLRNDGNLEKALSWYQDAYNLSVEVCGPENLATLDVAHNLSTVCLELGKLEMAAEYLKLSINGSLKLLRPTHPKILNSKMDNGYCLLDLGRYDEAMRSFEEVYEGRKIELRPGHPDTLVPLSAMAGVYENLEDNEKALELYKRVLDGYLEDTSPEPKPIPDVIRNLGRLLMDMDRNLEAFETLSKLDNIKGDNKRGRLYTKCLKAKAMMNLEGQSKPGIEMAKEGLEGLRKFLPEEHMYVMTALEIVATGLKKQGNNIEALEFITQLLSSYARTQGEDAQGTLDVMVEKADILLALKRKDEALALYSTAAKDLKRTLGDEHPMTVSTIQKEAALLQDDFKPASLPLHIIAPAVLIPAVAAAVFVYVRSVRRR